MIRRKQLGRLLMLVGTMTALSSSPVIAQTAVPAPGVPASERVAHNASEVPSDWIAAHPEGGCMANPFVPECGAPGHPITAAYYPSATQLAAQLDPSTAGTAASSVTLPSGQSLALAVASGPAPTANGASLKRSTKAHAAVAVCTLNVFAPDRINVGGDIWMSSGTRLSSCTANTLEANACSDLYQRTAFVAAGCDPEIGSPPSSLGTASYNCGHSDVIQYTNQGSGYIEDDDGNAGFNSGTQSANHSCT
jgi:hypothetical protein